MADPSPILTSSAPQQEDRNPQQQQQQQQQANENENGIEPTAPVHLPRITIKFCTQCKWMLRAAYFAQELLSTFSTSLGEVSLIPATGGVFTVTILHNGSSNSSVEIAETVLWDRKTEGGFPETKQLKSLVRNIIDPTRDLGHVDRALAKKQAKKEEGGEGSAGGEEGKLTASAEVCKDCD
ncbi:hypothetical protein AJ79_00397 [Helicocarpus griseus UAMH5409]|uniref:Selenoprotein W-like protein n=1 Tax=Helicocarpus griseus UAMH5409 TaxID=1447875 RepID=A0A2B7YCI5_9EURO|nr:hypothetical protein AJ79_00397 [Helicocarpus griseus UAMH5409]